MSLQIHRKITHNPKWKAVMWFFVYQKDKTRWIIWRQFDSPFCNHPFWVTLQKRGWVGWKNIGEIREPFYFQYGETIEYFSKRVISSIKGEVAV